MPTKKTRAKPLLDTPPPHSEDAEKGVLGSMLLSPKAIASVVDKIDSDYFFIPANQVIYNAMIDYWQAGKPIDLITFTQYLGDMQLLEGVGGAGYVTGLFTFVPTAANLQTYMDILKSKYMLRQVIAAGTEYIRKAYEEQSDAEAILSGAQEAFRDVKSFDKPEKSFKDYVLEYVERMESGEPADHLVLTSLLKLDEISPLRKGSMPLITGERKQGKSILAQTIMANVCLRTKKPGLYFSLEEPIPSTVQRLMANVSRVPVSRHYTSLMSEEDKKRTHEAANKLMESKIKVISDAFDLHTIIGRTKRYAMDNPDLAIVVVDYAQLIRVPYKKQTTRETEVASVSRAMRLLCMELNVPLLLLSQVNVDGRARESKALEQDATANIHVERDVEDEPNKLMVHIRWQRDGESGISFPTTFMGNIYRVENFIDIPEHENPLNRFAQGN